MSDPARLSSKALHNAARVPFFITGLLMAAWAPLVPYAKIRLGLDEGTLGIMLLCLGTGSLAVMPFTGAAASRFGCRRLIWLGTAITGISLIFLSCVSSIPGLAVSLFVYGAALGLVDVIQNIHASEVQKLSGRLMMSGFHGLFSLGGFAGAGGVSILLTATIPPFWAATATVAAAFASLAAWGSAILHEPTAPGKKEPIFVMPRGVVLLIGLMTFLVFLAEGTILDWGALFLSEVHHVAVNKAGLGYSAFAIAMTAGRLFGDHIIRTTSMRLVLRVCCASAAAGFALAALSGHPLAGFTGYVLIGLGCSNVVPILITLAGEQTRMPPNLAIAAVSMLGYSGILAGPALIGFIAHGTSLAVAFALVGVLVLSPAFFARRMMHR